ncbi:carbohydrate-binding family 9-like protein [Salegentibacter sp. BLCTC]|uniref:carbohydrate-binding family 9-like protein n=1 Tax=Salegentibacter sp. BLCTC TaxID=2697368 RepID=UPI00187B4A0E|nr:carbohydrate-binding family 9-like protein [Salegentibacter sp. BLCTC]MBE7640661.1 carbohydrate-binding family 9-like protein [Salegentibacter sp. BLCTC]
MKYKLLVFIIGVFALNSAYAQNPPRSYIAYKTIDEIEIDGRAEEASWKEAPRSKDFIDIEGDKVPKYQTYMKMVYDEDNLYFYAKMKEPHIWGTLKQRDTVIFYNNDFEIFIDPDGDTHNYMEFEMNALNTVWDLFIVKPYREPAPIVDSWDIQGLQSAVHISGTLNDASDEDDYWSVEVAIPWEVLKEANIHNNIPEEEFWRVNFSRVNWDFDLTEGRYSRKKDKNGEYLPEYNWVWSPQGVINMHEPEHWGYVYFSSKNAGEQDEFEIPEDEKVKWMLYKLYRKHKNYFSKNKKWASSISEIENKPIKLNGETLQPKLETHLAGWNIAVISPFTGKQYIIREDGKILTSKIK